MDGALKFSLRRGLNASVTTFRATQKHLINFLLLCHFFICRSGPPFTADRDGDFAEQYALFSTGNSVVTVRNGDPPYSVRIVT